MPRSWRKTRHGELHYQESRALDEVTPHRIDCPLKKIRFAQMAGLRRTKSHMNAKTNASVVSFQLSSFDCIVDDKSNCSDLSAH